MLFLLSAVLLAAAQAAGPGQNEVSRIVVQGWASVKDNPNVAEISYDVRGDGSTSDQAVAALVARSGAIEKALRSVDPGVQIHSDSVRIQIVRPKDCEENDYRDDAVHLSTGECAIKGYVAVQDFDFRTARVADAGTLVGLAGRRGAYNPKIDSYALADEKEAKRRAIASAMADARTKADAVAAGTGARLGKILSVTLDNARDESEAIVVTGYLANAAAERDEPIPVSVNPSPVSTTAQVTVSYAIVR
jgi:uncharacterized protein YggE